MKKIISKPIKVIRKEMTERAQKLKEEIYNIKIDPPSYIIDKLNERQMRFAEFYTVHLDHKKAYKEAGYTGKRTSMHAAAGRLLNDEGVKRYIDWLFKQKRKRNSATADNCLREIAALAFSNIKYFCEWTETNLAVYSKDKISDEDARAIKRIKRHKTNYGTFVEIELFDKLQALRLLGESLSLFNRAQPVIEDSHDKAEQIKYAADKLFASVPSPDFEELTTQIDDDC